MSQPAAIGPENPSVLRRASQRNHQTTNRRQLNVPSCPDLPGIQGVDDPLANNHSFDLFAYRVNKRKDKLSGIRTQDDQRYFGPEDRLALLSFLKHLDLIIRTVAEAQDTKQLPTSRIKMLLQIYKHWTDHNLLPRDPTADNVVTLLDKADSWLNKGFLLRRWAVKIMSFKFVISTNRLFMLTQSRRLYKVFQGKFFVTILPSPPTTPYRCKLSSETIKIALDSALADTFYLSARWDDDRESFINHLQDNLNSSEDRRNPTVHAELAMIMAMVNKEIDDVFPYIGVSKPSCIMCSQYIDIFKNITKQVIATKGSHGKAYPGWFWPNLPSIDGELRPAFMKAIRQQLLDDYLHHVTKKRACSNSDSSVGSDLPMVEVSGADDDGILMSFEGYVH